MASWTTRTTYGGKPANQGLKYLQQAANKMLADPAFGGEKSPVTWYQGAYSRGSLSAGTHSAGDAADTTPYNWRNRLKVYRLLGAAAWRRTRAQGPWVEHIHFVVCGGAAAPVAQRQVTAYYNGRNGLAGNGRDDGPKMLVFPLFVFPEKAVGKPGRRWCKTACHAYEQPTTKAKNLGPIKVGTALDVVAVVNVSGQYWGITANGRCVYEGNFQRTPVDAGGDDEEPAPVPSPAPSPTPAPAPQFRWLNINVCADYCSSSYSSRLSKLGSVRSAARASLVVTTESGNYDDGARLNRAFGFGGKRGESFILHGGSVPITTAVHWNPDTYRLRDEGQFETTGSTHRYATWVKLEHRESQREFIVGATHLIPWPIGPNTVKKYDLARESAFNSFLRQLDKIAGGLPVLAVGDLNGKRSDPYDGPGKAMTAHRYTEALPSTRIIDRACGKRVTFSDVQVLPTRGATDHDTAVAGLVRLD